MVNFVPQTSDMELNKEMVEKLAKLSQLDFNETEKEAIRKDLEQMIGFVEKLNEIDTTGIEPLTHINENENSLREDIVKGSVDTATALTNAPHSEGNFFTVPKVIKK
jgi:aspartyl-tRNA(Asn)/glutamyl-tRNA(Gln) amidotransferase subunit C